MVFHPENKCSNQNRKHLVGWYSKEKIQAIARYRKIQFYKNKQASADPTVKKYISEEWIP